jgi:hypothetical protein
MAKSILGASFAVGLAALGFGLGCGDQGGMQGAAEDVREEAEDLAEATGELAEETGEAAEEAAEDVGVEDATDQEDEEKATQ